VKLIDLLGDMDGVDCILFEKYFGFLSPTSLAKKTHTNTKN
jgi:hypothetical protein